MSQSTSSDTGVQAVPGNGTSLGRFAARVAGPLGGWWRGTVIPSIEHRAVIAKVDDEASLTPRYAFMILMSAGIAVLGLLLSSPAVVIGAMLISPLMGPIIGLGFGMALVDGNEIRRTAMTLAGGVLLAILFSALVVFFSPIKDITPEIAARTRPNLFDLLVALFSALAGAYAMIRGREGTIVGVAIATALMPPLATVGFGLATLNATVFFGSLLLFVTNLMTIAIAAAIMARLYGFGPKLTSRQSGMQAAVIIAVLLGLAIPLGYSLSQIAWEARAQRQARDVLADQFPRQAKIDQLEIDFSGEPLAVRATVLTPEYRGKAAAQGETLLAQALGRPVKLSLDQFRVGTAAGDAEAAQIASASAREQTRKEQATAALVGRELAILAGVSPEAVLIDRDKRLAQVRAAALPGATLATYRALEQRLSAAEPQWKMQLVPPPLPLPVIGMTGDEFTDDGTENLALAIWAARRTGIPVIVSGPARESQIVLTKLAEAGIDTGSNESSSSSKGIRLTWALQTGLDDDRLGGKHLGAQDAVAGDGIAEALLAAFFSSADLLASELLLFAGVWFLIGAIDDFALDFVWLINQLRPSRRARRLGMGRTASPMRFAVFVPAWDEADVIGDMVAHSLTRWTGDNFRLYVGAYANDPATYAAALAGARGDTRLRLISVDVTGPSSKADCLNRLWRAMRADEVQQGWACDAVVLHDAEDVVHPAEFELYQHWLVDHDFVQIPVWPLIDPASRLIGGHYADEFAEAHLRKMPVRSRLGVAMPCAGVGCAFRHAMLQALGRASGDDAPFATDSLTEDYELGIRIHERGGRGVFVRERDSCGDLVATRAFFPGELSAAVRQKTRWMIGIALSGWDRTGWGGSIADIWMRARDRRSALAALVLVAGYLGLALWSVVAIGNWLDLHRPAPLDPAAHVLLVATGCALVWRLFVRAACTGWNHGWREALWSLPRAFVSNIIAVMAARRALLAYAASLRGGRLAWDKTRHRIPSASHLQQASAPASGAMLDEGHG